MRDQNQVLFYRLMQDHLKELLGILYTPGAAEAVMGYSYLFRRPLGCFIVSTPSLERRNSHDSNLILAADSHYVSGRTQSFPNQDGMRAQLEAHVESLEKQADLTALAERADSSSLIDLIVVTDSEAVLGIGGTSRGSLPHTLCLFFR